MSRDRYDYPTLYPFARYRDEDEEYEVGRQREIEAGTKMDEAKRKYGRPFGTNGKTTKGITFWTAERIHDLAQANHALRIERSCK